MLLLCLVAGQSRHDAHAAFAQAAIPPSLLVGDLRRHTSKESGKQYIRHVGEKTW
jgi:hypothetical protein